jgi:dTDP-4-dehydrorhamnose 3,5-epimerase
VTREATGLDGVWLLDLDTYEDERGFFARLWSAADFGAEGLAGTLDSCSLSFNHRAGTLRGMHYQAAPSEEIKIVRCVRGAIYDVVLDLRANSPTFKRWVAHELTAENRLAFYIPRGCAHGFQTLTDGAEVLYLIAGSYDPGSGRGVRWNDPAFNIEWPMIPTVIADRDRTFADYKA